MTLGETLLISKEGIARWFQKMKKCIQLLKSENSVLLCTLGNGLAVRHILSILKHILFHLVKLPPPLISTMFHLVTSLQLNETGGSSGILQH